MLKVKLLHPDAKAPTVAHPGEDLAYDVYALESAILQPASVTKIRTGVALEYKFEAGRKYGFLARDRSSMASKGVTVSGGVIDAGYRDEILVLLTFLPVLGGNIHGYVINEGDKIAQLLPYPVFTDGEIQVVEELSGADRGLKGFGSSGR